MSREDFGAAAVLDADLVGRFLVDGAGDVVADALVRLLRLLRRRRHARADGPDLVRENMVDVDIPWRRVAAAPRPWRGHSVETSRRRGYVVDIPRRRVAAVATTWTFRGDESRRRRAPDVSTRARTGSYAMTTRDLSSRALRMGTMSSSWFTHSARTASMPFSRIGSGSPMQKTHARPWSRMYLFSERAVAARVVAATCRGRR